MLFLFVDFFLCTFTTWAGEPVQIRLLYLNDFHGFAEPYQPIGSPNKLGGISYLAEEVNRLRAKRPTLLLAAGDMIQGNPWANLFEGKSTIEAMNAMNFSAMVLGNHEFDFGQEVLIKVIGEAQFPVLAANVHGLPGIKPYIVKEISGIKIAIIGLVTETTPSITHPKNVEGLFFSSAPDSAQKVLKELGVRNDLVIVLSHLGLPADRRLSKAVKGIQIIVGGHTHTRIEVPIKVNETIIVQAWEHAKVLGVLDLTIQDRKVIAYEGKLIDIRPDRLEPDLLLAEIVNRYKNQMDAILDEVIGEAQVDLQAKDSRIQETNLGNLVADALREKTKADVALINGGGLQTGISKGPIYRKDLLTALPFRNQPVILRVFGRELEDILEHGLSDQKGTGGQFPQVSGLDLTYNPFAPSGQRITSLLIQGKPVNPDVLYTLATLDFLASGGDGYIIFKKILKTTKNFSNDNSRIILFDAGKEIRDLMIDYIKERKQIFAEVEGRIRIEK